MTIHLIEYTAHTTSGTEHGIARVHSHRSRPTWQECHEQIPGYRTGSRLGSEPQYTLTYATPEGAVARTLSGTRAIETMGAAVTRAATRGEAWDILVTDQDGHDITFNFACFCG
ncbi:hypothetical protein [Streptomyces albireticuli]|uniref:Uncharacterized protein n=1 Tax=Streptomyces albireticuli TaxID=1940 RepID=A0A2A2D432_9ACTN|nr:hypothetical protein [Streptomyces albireticuli]MCD9196090.1 hypothetical protein [Streptomyces albireticuli]PAU46159.1 hypothetical protein CK936_25520 [Streptomyces albireticuli]